MPQGSTVVIFKKLHLSFLMRVFLKMVPQHGRFHEKLDQPVNLGGSWRFPLNFQTNQDEYKAMCWWLFQPPCFRIVPTVGPVGNGRWGVVSLPVGRDSGRMLQRLKGFHLLTIYHSVHPIHPMKRTTVQNGVSNPFLDKPKFHVASMPPNYTTLIVLLYSCLG